MKKAIPVLKSLWFLMIIALVFLGRDINFPALILLILIAILAPIIREFRSKTDLDERQIQISHYSSHLAYFIYSFLLIFVIVREWVINREIPSLLLFVLICLPLLAKIATCLYQNYGGVTGFSGFINLFFRGILPAKKIDERQSVIGNLSSHIAFYIFLTLTLVVVLYNYVRLDLEPAPMWHMLLLVPLMIKLYTSLFQSYGAAKGAQSIIYLIAGLGFIFVLLSHGFSLGALMEALPFILILGIIILSKLLPKITGGFLLLIAIALTVFFHGFSNSDLYIRILMVTLIPVPLLLSGLALLTHRQ